MGLVFEMYSKDDAIPKEVVNAVSIPFLFTLNIGCRVVTMGPVFARV